MGQKTKIMRAANNDRHQFQGLEHLRGAQALRGQNAQGGQGAGSGSGDAPDDPQGSCEVDAGHPAGAEAPGRAVRVQGHRLRSRPGGLSVEIFIT